MKDEKKTKGILIKEIETLRQKVMELEEIASRPSKTVGSLADNVELLNVNETGKRSEENYHWFLDSLGSNFVFFMTDTKGYISYISPWFEKVTGYSIDNINNGIRQFLTDSPLNKTAVSNFDKIMEGETVEPFEVEYLNKEGKTSIMSVSITQMHNSTGQFIGLQGIAQEITSIKRVQDELKRSESRFRELFENAPIPMWVEDCSLIKKRIDELKASGVKDFRSYFAGNKDEAVNMIGLVKILDINQASLDDMKIGSIEDIKIDMMSTFTDESIKIFTEGLINISKGIIQYDYETPIIDTGGNTIWYQIYFKAWPGHENDLSQVIVSFNNITARKLAEDAIKVSEGKYRSLFESVREGILMCDMQGQFIDCNNVICEMLGYSREELLKLHFIDITPSKWHESDERVLSILAKNNFVEDYEKEYQRKDGSIVAVLLKTYLNKDASGNPISRWVQVKDITQQKKAENIIRLNEDRLKSQLRVAEYHAESFDDLMNKILKEAISISSSRLGFISIYREDSKTFYPNYQSKEAMKECRITEKDIVYELDKMGIQAEPLRTGKPLILNDFNAPHPAKRGYPEGHAKLYKYLGMPVYYYGKIVAIIGFANREEDYNEVDVVQLTLFMNSAWNIVQRWEAETALKESEERFRDVSLLTTDFIYELDRAGNFTCVSEGILDIVGYKPQDILGKSIFSFISGDDLAEVIEITEAAVREKRAINVAETRIKKIGSTELIIRVFFKSLFNEDGKLIGFRGVGKDITDEKHAQLALKESEERYRSLYESVSDGVAMVDMNLKLIDCNDSYAELLGYSKEELLTLGYDKKTPSKWHNIEADIIKNQVMIRGYSDDYEKEYIRKDGSIIPASLKVFLVKDPLGNPKSMWAFARDITDKKRIERLTLQNEERLNAQLRVADYKADSFKDFLEYVLKEVLILTRSTIGYVHRYDDYMKRFEVEAWSKEAMQDCAIPDKPKYYDLDTTGLWAEPVRQRSHIIINDFQAPNPLKRGYPESHIEIQRFMTIPVLSEDTVIAVVGVGNKSSDYDDNDVMQLSIFMRFVWNIIERMESEKGQEKLLEEINQKNKELEDIVYVTSHDLRSPLVNIQGFSQLIEMASSELKRTLSSDQVPESILETVRQITEENIPKSIGFIKNSVTKMDALINGLLRLSRTGRALLSVEPLDMNGLIKAIVNTVRFQIEETGTIVEISELPSCMGDAGLINQVFSNLIDNAIKYRDLNRSLVISVSGVIDEESAVYTIRDTGKGIEAQYQDKIWELFRRLDNSIPGEGLGLTLVRRIIDKHGGKINMESEFGVGTVFTIRLPLRTE